MSRLGLAAWHLLPANPILVRVVFGAGRRTRHFWLRVGYLSALLAIVLVSLTVFVEGKSGLNELAKGASQTFKLASYTQMILMCFLAPIFTAGAITQERDAQTYNILLSTPLSNAQIVLGSLMSRLYFVLMLLLAGLPIFCVTMVYGGVTTSQITQSFALAAATAVLMGSLAIFISVAGIGTRRTIFSFYLMIAMYLLAFYLLGQWQATWVAVAPENTAGVKMSALAALHPFLSLEVALNRIQAPDISLVASRSAIMRYALAYPAATYVTWTLTSALVLTTLAMFFVRRGAKTGEPTFFGELLGPLMRSKSGERTRKLRTVWSNPVAWREANTRSAAGAGGLTRWTLIIGSALATLVLFAYHLTDPATLDAALTRQWLAAVIMIEFAIAAMVATNTAATSMTREKESKTMDILLTTPLTSKYILWGKLRGLVSFATPLIVVPVASLVLFGLFGLLPGKSHGIVWIESALEIAAAMILFIAFACVISLRFSLTNKKTVKAVMASLLVLLVVTGGATMIDLAIMDAAEQAGAFFAPFTPFTAIWGLVNPASMLEGSTAGPAGLGRHEGAMRVMAVIGTLIAVAVYTLVVYTLYTNLVRNFDMIVRKQSGT